MHFFVTYYYPINNDLNRYDIRCPTLDKTLYCGQQIDFESTRLLVNSSLSQLVTFFG